MRVKSPDFLKPPVRRKVEVSARWEHRATVPHTERGVPKSLHDPVTIIWSFRVKCCVRCRKYLFNNGLARCLGAPTGSVLLCVTLQIELLALVPQLIHICADGLARISEVIVILEPRAFHTRRTSRISDDGDVAGVAVLPRALRNRLNPQFTIVQQVCKQVVRLHQRNEVGDGSTMLVGQLRSQYREYSAVST